MSLTMKPIYTILFVLVNFMAFSQTSFKIDSRARKFYKSFDDYKADKAIEGIKLKELYFFGTTIEIENNGKIEKIKESKNPYSWFCDTEGLLMRVVDGTLYYVLTEGPICHYVKKEQAWVGYNIVNGAFDGVLLYSPTGNEPYKEYYSETINGEVKQFKDKMFDELLEKYGLKEQYEADKLKREMKDSVMDYKNKEWRKRLKYKKLINDKMKV